MQAREVPDLTRDVHCIMGLPFDVCTLPEAALKVRNAAVQQTPLFVSTPNINFLIAASQNTAFRDSVLHSDLVLADGMYVVWLAKLLGIPVTERVAGSNLFEYLSATPANDFPPLRIYFFGGPPGAAEQASQKVNASDPSAQRIQCVGHFTPGFGSIEEMSSDEVIADINHCQPDFVVVALGAAKGQAWIEYNQARIQAPVFSHLGAVVNMAANTVRRAPVWMQRSGLEWAWRVLEEPQLWKRYYNDGVALSKLVLTRALPLALISLLSPRDITRPENKPQSDVMSKTPDTTALRLKGAWTAASLPTLRQQFFDVLANHAALELDLSEVTHVDSAFLGLLMLVRTAQLGRGKSFRISAVSRPCQRRIELAQAGYLLG